MTQGLHSAGAVDQECLEVASTCSLGFLPTWQPLSNQTSYRVAQGSKSEGLSGQGGNYVAFLVTSSWKSRSVTFAISSGQSRLRPTQIQGKGT